MIFTPLPRKRSPFSLSLFILVEVLNETECPVTVAIRLHFLDDAERDRLRAFVNQSDLSRAARALGVSRGVVSSAVAGIGVRKGSLEQLRDALAKKIKTEETK